MPFRWTINPYRGCSHACIYCFARPTHKYLDFDAGRDFEKEIVVKVNVPEVLRAELARPSWKGEHVAMGTNTDPYQWVEGRYKLMRGIWEALRDAAQPVLDPHEVAAAAARPRPDAGDRGGDDDHARTSRSRRWTRRRGGRPSRTRRTRRRGWRRSPSSTGPGSRAGSSSRRSCRASTTRPRRSSEILELAAEAGATGDRRDRAAPARRRQAGLHGLAARPTGRTSCRATRSSTRRGAYAPQAERERIAAARVRDGASGPARPGERGRLAADLRRGEDATRGRAPATPVRQRRSASP